MYTAQITARWRSKLTDPYLPEAAFLGWDEPEDEPAPDPLDRPDFDTAWPEDTPAPNCDELGRLYAPCACCGAETVPEGSIAHICPVCGWETDTFILSDDEPSDQNHGLTLDEARLNFRVFGICDPSLRWETE